MSKKKGERPARAPKSKVSNTTNVLKDNKSIAKCYECACSVMKLSDGKVIQYCLTYTEPCQDAIKICVVV